MENSIGLQLSKFTEGSAESQFIPAYAPVPLTLTQMSLLA
jgi:hypothetical protein